MFFKYKYFYEFILLPFCQFFNDKTHDPESFSSVPMSVKPAILSVISVPNQSFVDVPLGIRRSSRTAATQRVMKLVTVGQRYLPERLPVIPIRNEV